MFESAIERVIWQYSDIGAKNNACNADCHTKLYESSKTYFACFELYREPLCSEAFHTYESLRKRKRIVNATGDRLSIIRVNNNPYPRIASHARMRKHWCRDRYQERSRLNSRILNNLALVSNVLPFTVPQNR